MKPSFIISLIFLCPMLSNANNMETGISNRNGSAKELSSNINFEYSFIRNRITHEESSVDTNFTSFEDKSNYIEHRIGVGYQKEFLSTSLFSITVLTSLGVSIGEESKNGEDEKTSITSIDKVSGYYAGAGLSLNYNLSEKETRTQLFLASKALKATNAYFLRYGDSSSVLSSTEIEYKEDLSIIENSIGLRFFNFSRKMLSTIAINFYSYNQNKLSVDASQGESDFELGNLAKIQKENASLHLGFGVLF